MDWLEKTLDQLASAAHWSYREGGTPSTEPTALAALALAAHGRHVPARRARQWLLDVQAKQGCLGISDQETAPHWPTAWAVLAWKAAAGDSQDGQSYDEAIQRATAWMLSIKGEVAPQTPDLGHNSMLHGWPWVEGTHSWIEPTALDLLALKATGNSQHPRAREAVRLLIDRLLPQGGCNYGNTSVLGQMLRPHLEPTGLTLLALAGENDETGVIENSLQYAYGTIGESTTAASLGYSLIGLAAHGQLPPARDQWLAMAAERVQRRVGFLPRLALLALAARGAECPLVTLTKAA
jgi:hypothetical protein